MMVESSVTSPANFPYQVRIDFPMDCDYDLSPTLAEFNEYGGAGTIQVSTSPECGLDYSIEGEWIRVVSSWMENGEGYIDYEIEALPSHIDSREGRLVFDGAAVDISQARTPSKAIIVTGETASLDRIQNGIHWCAGHAYKNLIKQGFSVNDVFYVSSGPLPDPYQSAIPNDLHRPSTKASLEYACRDWADDAEQVILYMVGHGGQGNFRINDTELVDADELDLWLDELQEESADTVVFIYDACRSGSFIDRLQPPSGKKRVLMFSAEEDQPAIFADSGTVSFSFFFWGRIAGGDSFYEAFTHAENSLGLVTDRNQSPLIDIDGDAIGNERSDRSTAREIRIGKQTNWLDEVPYIGQTTQSQEISRYQPLTIFAREVVDEDGIASVRAVVTSPGAWTKDKDLPVSESQSFELTDTGGGVYEAVCSSFSEVGTYLVSIFAEDKYGAVSNPKTAYMTVSPSAAHNDSIMVFPFSPASDGWNTRCGVINRSAVSEIQGAFVAYDEEGNEVDPAIDVVLPVNGCREIEASQVFASPEKVAYVVFETDRKDDIAGYFRPCWKDEYRACMPAVENLDCEELLVSHIASDDCWQTRVVVVNANSFDSVMGIEFNNGDKFDLQLRSKQMREFLVRDLFDGQTPADIESARITNAYGIAGAVLFSNGRALSGVLMDNRLGDTLLYPHIVSDNRWKTGLVGFNPWSQECKIVVKPYLASGAALADIPWTVPGNARYIGTVSNLMLPAETAWVRLEADHPVTGFELFTTADTRQLAGYSGVDIAGTSGVLPLFEKGGVSGIALVNVGEKSVNVQLTGYEESGEPVCSAILPLSKFEKYVSVLRDVFPSNFSKAIYVKYSASQPVVCFVLNADKDGKLLDGVQGLQ